MTLKRKLLVGGGIVFAVLMVLASMNIVIYQQVIDNINARDEERHALNEAKKLIEWRNALNRHISEMVAAEHVPSTLEKQMSSPVANKPYTAPLIREARPLIQLVREKSNTTTTSQARFDASRREIIALYHDLEEKIATVLAIIQMEQVLGTNAVSNKEKSTLAPYVLKSLNQLTLIALNSLVTHRYSEKDRQKVGVNKKFLNSQLHIIDTDHKMAALFKQLFKQIDIVDQLIPQTSRAIKQFDKMIANQQERFKRAMDSSDADRLFSAAEKKVQSADASLKTTSRRTLIASIILLFGVPPLILLMGAHRLNQLIVEPIGALIKTMKAFEQGQMDTEASVYEPDEIGVLSRSFNAMAKQIRAKVAELDLLNQALSENERRLKAIFESSPNPILVFDMNWRCQYANPAFCDVFGWIENNLKGETLASLIPNDFKAISEDRFNELYRTGAPVKFMVRWHTTDKRHLEVVVNAAPINGAQNIQGVVVNLTDISEQKSLEAQLSQAQKMESIGRLAGGVAHDYNNMLAVILGRADMALERISSDNPLYQDLSAILTAATRSIEITRQLLAFSRKQTIVPKHLNFKETIENMLKMLRHLIGEDIKLDWRPGNRVCEVFMDASQIDQILMNLCVNSRDAISEKGIITIETDIAVFDESYCARHSDSRPGEFVVLTVSDDGCGMDGQTQQQIFEPFFTTKSQGEGTGLGLATVYGIVKQNHGFINCYSEPGQGTTFRIFLPRHMPQAVETPTTDCLDQGVISSGQETILLVEDESILLEMTQKMLTQLGYTVFPASSADEAISSMENHADAIDLLITDVVMPDLNGKELAETLLKIRNDLQVLYISGYPSTVMARRGILDERVHFLSKPFTQKDLADKVKITLDKRTC